MGAGAAVGVVVALGLLAWMFTGGEPQVDKASDHAAGAASHDGVAKKKAKKKSKKKKKESGPRLVLAGPFGSKEECLKAIEGRKDRPATAPLRIGSWNIRWFPRGGEGVYQQADRRIRRRPSAQGRCRRVVRRPGTDRSWRGVAAPP